MIFRERKDDPFYFNGKTIEIVEEYKYLGVMISSINYRQKDVLLLIISTYVIKQDELSAVCTRKQNALVLYQWKLYFICFNIWYNQFCYMVVKYGVSAIPLIPKLTHFSIGSFDVPWVWNLPHPFPWSMGVWTGTAKCMVACQCADISCPSL